MPVLKSTCSPIDGLTYTTVARILTGERSRPRALARADNEASSLGRAIYLSVVPAAEASAEEAAEERQQQRADKDHNAHDPELREAPDTGEQVVLDEVIDVLGDPGGQEARENRVHQRENEDHMC